MHDIIGTNPYTDSMLQLASDIYIDIYPNGKCAKDIYNEIASHGTHAILWLKPCSIESKEYGSNIPCEIIYPPTGRNDKSGHQNIHCNAYDNDIENSSRIHIRKYGVSPDCIEKISVCTIQFPNYSAEPIIADKITRSQFVALYLHYRSRICAKRTVTPIFEIIKQNAFDLFLQWSDIDYSGGYEDMISSKSANPYLLEYFMYFKVGFAKLTEFDTDVLNEARAKIYAKQMGIFLEIAKEIGIESNKNFTLEKALEFSSFFEKFRPEVLLESATPIYIDTRGMSHILCRHYKYFKCIAQREGTKFDLDVEQILPLLKNVLNTYKEEITSTLEEKKFRIYLYKKQSLHYAGNYYSIDIEKNGSISTFFPVDHQHLYQT